MSSTQDETNLIGSLAVECEPIKNEDQEQVTKKKKKSKKKQKEKDKRAQETGPFFKRIINFNGVFWVNFKECLVDKYFVKSSKGVKACLNLGPGRFTKIHSSITVSGWK